MEVVHTTQHLNLRKRKRKVSWISSKSIFLVLFVALLFGVVPTVEAFDCLSTTFNIPTIPDLEITLGNSAPYQIDSLTGVTDPSCGSRIYTEITTFSWSTVSGTGDITCHPDLTDTQLIEVTETVEIEVSLQDYPSVKESVFFQVTFGPTCDQATLEPSSSANIEIEEVELEVPNVFPKTLL